MLKYSSSKHHHHHKRTIKSFYESIIPYIFRRSHKLWIEQINTNGGLLKWFKWSATDLSKIEQIEIKLTTN